MADPRQPQGPILPPHMLGQAPQFHVPGPSPLQQLAQLLEENQHSIQSWTQPFEGPSRAIGSLIAGRNPFQGGRIEGPTVSEALTDRGVHPAVAMGAEFLVPDPTGASRAADLIPLLGLLMNVPKGLQRALSEGVHPSLLDEEGLLRQLSHGSKEAAFERPNPGGAIGTFGGGHYMSTLEPSSAMGAQGGPLSNLYNMGDAPRGQHTRLDAAALRNPFVAATDAGSGVSTAKLIPDAEQVSILRSWLEYARPHSRSAENALALMDDLDGRIAALGADADVSLAEWGALEWEIADALRALRFAGEGVATPELTGTTMLSRAYGVDGAHISGEVVAFDPAMSVINGLESAVERLRREGYSDEAIAAMDPVGWAMFREGSEWASVPQASRAPVAPPRYPLTELGEAAVPTPRELVALAERDEGAVRDWLRAWGVDEAYAGEVLDSAVGALIAPGPISEEALTASLRSAFDTIDDPDIAAALKEALEPIGAHSPLITPDPRLYRERELADLRPVDERQLAQAAEARASVRAGGDSWLGRSDAPPPDLATLDAQVDEYLERVRGFTPTLEQPFPSGGAGSEANPGRLDVAAVLTGDKPGALFFAGDDPVMSRMLARAEEQGLTVRYIGRSGAGGDYVIANTPEAADELGRLFNTPAGERDHHRIADLLGYAPGSADDFVRRQELFQWAESMGFDSTLASIENWPRARVEAHLRDDLGLQLSQEDLDSMLRYWGEGQ